MKPLRVLVVEDEIFVRLTTVDMLIELGHEAMEADCGRAALEALDRDAKIELVLIDVGLPDMKGPTLAMECWRRRPALSIIFATGYDETSIIDEDGKRIDAVVLGKPFSIHDLTQALAAAATTAGKGTQKP